MTFTNERSATSSLQVFCICFVFLLSFFPGQAQTGTTWTARSYPAEQNWIGVTYGNNLFVAIASGGATAGNRIMTSPDGTNWTARTNPADNVWAAITYGNGVFVVVGAPNAGNTNTVMTSTDGITWTLHASADATSQWTAITYGGGKFVALAQTGGVRAMTSTDGITWNAQTGPAANTWTGITYGNGKFVGVAGNVPATSVVASSADGITWTSTTLADGGWNGVAFGNNIFVAVRNSAAGQGVMTSTDGVNWTLQSGTVTNAWRVVRYGGGLFVSLSITGTGNRVMTSPDGINWTARTSAADNTWRGLAYGNGMWVATSTNGAGGTRVMTSGSVTLPVTWLSFTAEVVGSNRELQWKTATESNNAYFDIERSGDGVVFVKIGQVAAADNATNGAAYSFTDRSPQAGKTYYRIKQVDKDARFEYSKTVSVDGVRTQLFSVFPNPVRDVLTVKGLADAGKETRFTISNATGLQVKAGLLPANKTVHVQSLPAGQYVLRIGDRAVHFAKQ